MVARAGFGIVPASDFAHDHRRTQSSFGAIVVGVNRFETREGEIILVVVNQPLTQILRVVILSGDSRS
jgi:hypothetical protein